MVEEGEEVLEDEEELSNTSAKDRIATDKLGEV